MDVKQLIAKGEDVADQVLRQSKHVMPHVARVFLLSTFIEDGFRMWFQWGEQKDYMNSVWNCGEFLGHVFVFVNLVGQLIPSGFIISRKFAEYNLYVLFSIVVIQTFAYHIIYEVRFLMRNLALIGGLLLLMAECKHESKSLFAGIPSMNSSMQPKTYFQLTGRILLILMFISLFHFDLHVIRLLVMVFEAALMTLVAVGYKTKLSALILSVWLFLMNFYFNNFWSVPYGRVYRDFLKYDFFQTLSIVGGLLMVVALGPGGVSMDEQKKKW
ncbi:surfeit locus protein 4-like [Symsagittifera roscoffensis]|uniref:surfeit locus protein 4-like n=1 Tax=Symsagittifera roscoffensis TaxID=84072 RepID=UPI00307B3864